MRVGWSECGGRWRSQKHPCGHCNPESCSTLLTEILSYERILSRRYDRLRAFTLLRHYAMLTTHLQPYLDSDMQSRWFDFGGDTIVRADQYVAVAVMRLRFNSD